MTSRDQVEAVINAERRRAGECERERQRLIQKSTTEAKLAISENKARRRAKTLKSVDVCFVPDVTASRAQSFKMVAQKAKEIGTSLCQTMGEGASVRVACAPYRDYMDEGHPQVFPFTTDLTQVQFFMQSLKADGGGDVCEDIRGGLQAATELTWKSRTRLLFLMPQTEQHGRRFHEQLRPCCDEDTLRAIVAKSDLPKDKHDELFGHMSCQFHDLYPEDPKQWDPMNRTIARLRDLDIRVVCLTMEDNPLERMLGVVRELYDDAAAGLSLKVMPMDMDPAAFCSSVTSASIEAVSSSMSRSRSTSATSTTRIGSADPRQLLPVQVTQRADAEWESRETWLSAYVTIIRYSATHTDKPPTTKKSTRRVSINPIPFGQGEMRMAFYVYDETNGFKLVGKVYRFENDEYQSKAIYEGDMHAQAVSRYLAKEFNKRYPQEPLEFVAAELLDLGEASPLPFFARYMALEPWISGAYKKKTNNFSYIGQDSEVEQAFSHFTFDFTEHYLMVTDLQGVGKTLTDPQIHCTDDDFGVGNLGVDGQDTFFAAHRCNGICAALNLKKHPCQMEGVCAACQEASAAQEPADEPAREPATEPAQEPAVVSRVDAFLAEVRRAAAGHRAAAAAAEEEEEVAGACLRWLEEPRVVRVLPGSAADRAGVAVGSCIRSVGGQPIKGMPREQVLQLLEAPDNVPVFWWPEEVLLQMARGMAAVPVELDLAGLLHLVGALHAVAASNLFIAKASADATEALAKARGSSGEAADELAGATLAWEHPPRVVGVAPGSPAEVLGLRGGELVVEVGGKDVRTLGRSEILALMQQQENSWEVAKSADPAAAQGTIGAQQPFAPPARPRAAGAALPEAAAPPADRGADKAAPPQAARPATDAGARQALERCRAQTAKMRQTELACSGNCGRKVAVDSADWVQGGQRGAFCTECMVTVEATRETRPCSTHLCDGQVDYSTFELTAIGLDTPKFCKACRTRATGEEASSVLAYKKG